MRRPKKDFSFIQIVLLTSVDSIGNFFYDFEIYVEDLVNFTTK